MMLKPLLHRDNRGIGAVEFALVAPVLISFIVGVSQVGRMFYANADMKNATAHGARLASIYRTDGPVDDATLIAAVKARLLREGAASKVTVTVDHGTDDGNPYVELHTTYSVPLEFIFFSTPPVTLHDSRRVFTQVASANETTFTTTSSSTSSGSTGSTSTTSTSTGSTSTGSTSTGSTSTSTSSTSTGGTSSTSASSTSGGSTSTSSTSGGTSASSTTSSTSSGNGSSGNGSSGNNGSSGHDHGDCKKKC